MMEIAIQFSVFLINKPGVLAQTLGELAKSKINILAMTMMDSMEHGVLRIVTYQPDQARRVFQQINAQVSETEVLCLTLPNRPGAFAAVAGDLAKAHININYAYCTAGAKGGKTTGILKVADLKKAMKIVEESMDHKPSVKKKAKERPGPARGRR